MAAEPTVPRLDAALLDRPHGQAAAPRCHSPPLLTDHRTARYNRKLVAVVSFLIGLCCTFVVGQWPYTQGSSVEHLLFLQPGITLARGSLQAIRKRVMRAEAKAQSTASAFSQGVSSSTSADAARAYHSASQFAAQVGVRAGCRAEVTCMQAVGAFFGKSSSHCKQADDNNAKDIDSAELKELAGYDGLLCGTPLWTSNPETGHSRIKWSDYMKSLRKGEVDASGRPVTVPGTGNSFTFSSAFCAALTEIHDAFEAVGAKMRGYVDSSNSFHDTPESESDLGFVLNMENKSDTTQDRVNAWVEQLKAESVPI